jgi:hypothetical protein
MNETIRSIAEQCSKPNSGVQEHAIFQLRPYIEGFLDRNWLERELNNYTLWASKNSDPFLQQNLLHRPAGFNILVASIWAARNWESTYKEDSSFVLTGGVRWLINVACSLTILEYHSGALLNTDAREHLQQRLQEAKKQVWGVIHELHTFAFFVRKGADVEPHFLQKASPQELTVHWHRVSIPVQCKVKPPGSGRIIPQDMFTDLASRIARDAKASQKRLLIRIGSTGTIREEDIEFLRYHALKGVGSGRGAALVTNNRRTFSVRSELLSGQFTTGTISNYLSSFAFHIGMIIGEPSPKDNIFDVVAVIGIEADLNEKRAWPSLQRSIKDGARQLENGPPGIIAIYYADPVKDFEDLCPVRGKMRIYVGERLDHHPHVGAVILASEPDLQFPRVGSPGRVVTYYRKPWPFPKDFLSNESR